MIVPSKKFKIGIQPLAVHRPGTVGKLSTYCIQPSRASAAKSIWVEPLGGLTKIDGSSQAWHRDPVQSPTSSRPRSVKPATGNQSSLAWAEIRFLARAHGKRSSLCFTMTRLKVRMLPGME